MRSRFAALLVAGLLASGCVSTQPAALDTPDGRALVNVRASHSPARVYVDGEPVHYAVDLRIDAVEATWRDRFTGAMSSAPTERVRAVTFWGGGESVLRGAGIGALAGLGLGVATIVAASDCDGFCPRPVPLFAITVLPGALVGGTVGGFQWTRMDRLPAPP